MEPPRRRVSGRGGRQPEPYDWICGGCGEIVVTSANVRSFYGEPGYLDIDGVLHFCGKEGVSVLTVTPAASRLTMDLTGL